MASNSLGVIFRITTWGESHGKAIGVVVDGCPAGLELSEEDICKELQARMPGKNPLTSPRKESDNAQILSGVFEGKTTGCPISIIIFNEDADSSKYEPIKTLLRPGHANFTYLEKYGFFDFRGGGRASGRETACRVAAGAIAKKLLRYYQMDLIAFIKELGGIEANISNSKDIEQLKKERSESSVFCPDSQASKKMIEKIEDAKQQGDSLGGIIELRGVGIPAGLGDPLYEKLQANLAKALMSIPAAKGVEFGSGFESARMKGSEHNDSFSIDEQGSVVTKTNHAGGILGGLTTGMPLIVRVAFKPTSSILKIQETVNTQKESKNFQIPEGSRHDPCLALRAAPVVEAMAALVLADALLMNRCSTLT